MFCWCSFAFYINFALCVATKLTWVGACIPPGLQNTRLANCVAWQRGGYAETRPAATNTVSCVTRCLLLSPPSSHCKTARVSTAAALLSTAYPSHKHSSSQPQPQPPSTGTKHSSTQQENVRQNVYDFKACVCT